MVAFTVKTEMSPRLRSILMEIAPETRRALFSVGANALRLEVIRHIRHDIPRRHIWSDKLSAPPTHHLEKGVARVTSRSTTAGAEVNVPIAGISRAFHDLVITPVKAPYLTIPIASAAYGHRARELRRMGWKIFKIKNHDVLMGRRGEEKEFLYALKKKIVIRQDRSLLPDDATVAQTINNAVSSRIHRLINAA